MSEWLNNKKIIYENSEKPCHKLGWCPYGQLVEEFPIMEEETKYAVKKGWYSKLVKGKGWVECSKDDKEATPDINRAGKFVSDKFECGVFGHHCPVFYHREDWSEE